MIERFNKARHFSIPWLVRVLPLREFFERQPVEQPLAFARGVLNLVLRKPASSDHRRAAAAFNLRRRDEKTGTLPATKNRVLLAAKMLGVVEKAARS